MPATLSYPGVYVEEIPSGVHTIVGVATSITAFIGRAASGPINHPVMINGFADYERTFSGLDSSSADELRGPRLLLERGFAGRHRPALPCQRGGDRPLAPEDRRLKFVAADPGSWGENLRAYVDRNVKDEVAKSLGLTDATDLFSLTVFESIPGGLRESFSNLSIKKSTRRVDKVLKAQSVLLRWDDSVDLNGPAGSLPAIPGSNILGAPAAKQAALDKAKKDLDDAQKKVPPPSAAELKPLKDAVANAQSELTKSQLDLTSKVIKDDVSAAEDQLAAATTEAQRTAARTALQAAQSAMKASDGGPLVFPDDFKPDNVAEQQEGAVRAR